MRLQLRIVSLFPIIQDQRSYSRFVLKQENMIASISYVARVFTTKINFLSGKTV